MAEAVITIDINKDYRILGEPLPNKYSTTLMVTFDATRSLQPRTAIIPEPRTFSESPPTFTYHAYDGTVLVKMPFKADENAAPAITRCTAASGTRRSSSTTTAWRVS